VSQITLRGLDPKLEKEIRSIAKKTGKSLNRVVQEMLRQCKGQDEKPAAHSLRELAGGWTDQDAREFYESIKTCEQVDEAMWK
jgi:plasmid stability protein